MSDNKTKKRKADPNVHRVSKKQPPAVVPGSTDRATLHAEMDYSPLTLQDIHDRIQALCLRVPVVPDCGFLLSEGPHMQATHTEDDEEGKPGAALLPSSDDKASPAIPGSSTLPQPKQPCPYDKSGLREWATALQTVLEEFLLIVALSSPATYVWGTDRSGAAEQNLGLLSAELVRSQEQILARVTPRLNDVLAPVVSILTDKTVITKLPNGTEVKQNYFVASQEDPDYVDLCYGILARNAPLLRQVVLANFDKLLHAIQDYLTAQRKDSQHDSRGFVY